MRGNFDNYFMMLIAFETAVGMASGDPGRDLLH
jgi:hypothetical protein